MNEPFLIVGGGISGMLVARFLRSKGLNFLGLEKEETLGGRLAIGDHKIYDRLSAEIFSTLGQDISWSEITELAKARKKGEWVNSEPMEESDEKFLTKAPFFRPSRSYRDVISNLAVELGEHFLLNANVVKVSPSEKWVELQSGDKITFERLFWCTDLALLPKVLQGDKTELLKVLKNAREGRKGINIDLNLNAVVIPAANTALISFRFKDKKLRAFGTTESIAEGGQVLHWLLFLDDDFADDHEEVAKCLRSFRRELDKELPEIKLHLTGEKISFLSQATGEAPFKSKNAEILPGIFYLGAQMNYTREECDFRNLDMLLHNYQKFTETFA